MVADIEKLLKTGDGVLWLTDRKGRRVGVPVAKVAYVEWARPRPNAGSGSARPDPPAGTRGRRPQVAVTTAAPDLLQLKLVFVTGKGGVGKTTVAAGLTQLAAEHGQRCWPAKWTPRVTCPPSSRRRPPTSCPGDLPGIWSMSMDTEASLREYLKLQMRIPVVGRIGPWPRPSTSWPPPRPACARS